MDDDRICGARVSLATATESIGAGPMSVTGAWEDDVVLLDEQGQFIGGMPKAGVHHVETPLHLAFSGYLFNTAGRVLLTRRAQTKRTWPGVLTNSCCGHPKPGEDLVDAVRRKVATELGLKIGSVELVLPEFRYRAKMDNGVVENEMCTVFRASVWGGFRLNTGEVSWAGWRDWDKLLDAVRRERLEVSPWCRLQLAELAKLGPDPFRWPRAEASRLPLAVRGQFVGESR